jgi:hypothetical protein
MSFPPVTPWWIDPANFALDEPAAAAPPPDASDNPRIRPIWHYSVLPPVRNPTLTNLRQLEDLAWLGDSLHRTLVRQALFASGHSRDGLRETHYTEAKHQADYIRSLGYRTGVLSDHSVSTFFEYKFATETTFQRRYVRTVFPDFTDLIGHEAAITHEHVVLPRPVNFRQ